VGDLVAVFEPLYIFYFLILVGLLYLPVCFYTIYKFRFNAVGILLVILSIVSYLLIGKYMVDSGYYADEHSSTLFGLGFLELTLLSYPYIFIVLSILIGKKGERIKN
jgi:hypothetical membrane protein